MVVSGVTYIPAVACSPLLDSQMQIKKSAIQYTGNCGTLCTVKTLENGDGTSDAPRPRWPRTHSTTRVTRVQRRAPHRNHVSTGPCPGRAADNPKDVPNAALILLWLSSSQGLPVPQGPCTQRKYTYLNNPPRCLSLCAISLSFYCLISTQTIPRRRNSQYFSLPDLPKNRKCC